MNLTNKQRTITLAIASALVVASLSACKNKEDTPSLIAQAKQFQQQGDNKAAVIQLKNAVANSPENAEARLLLAHVYLDNGDPVSAEKEIRKAISLGASADQNRPALLQAMLAQGLLDKVITESADPASAKDAAVQIARGDAYLGLGQAEAARQAYNNALGLKPASPTAL